MNPYGVPSDLFQSQANQSANSFSDPLNISHLYPGWGMNPNYQTPAHDAPYRPGYSGPDPYSFYGKPTFAGALNQTISPFYKDPYWGNPVDHNQPAYNSIGQKPFDAAATVGQRLVMPALAVGLTMSATKGIFGAFGAGIGHGLGAGIGSHVGAAGPMQLTSGARALGAVGKAAGWFGSLALGLAVADTADSMIFQPYIRSRQMANTTQDHFSGVTFGGNYGNPVSGKGLSGSASARIGSEIDKIGINDMTFSANQIGGIASMGMKAGMFDDVSAGGISKRVSSIAAQIKTILAISKDPNIQTAIAELSKLQAGGASISGGALSQAAGVYGGVGAYASAAGASVQRVMNTVGQQGQYMYQMNGMTPYLGQMAAAQAFAGFTSAYRAGVISQGALSRMGGAEGATQSALAAQLTSAQTPYNQISNFNRFIMGNKQNGVIDNVSAFGQAVAKDPLRARGAQILHGKTMDSMQAELDGPKGPEKQAADYLRSIGQRPGPNGKYDPNHIAAVLKDVIGMPEEQVKAYMTMRMAQTNPEVAGQNLQAFNAQETEQLLQYASQNSLQNTVLGRTVRSVRRGYRAVAEGLAEDLAYPVSRAAGAVSDSVASGLMGFAFGDTVKDRSKEYVSLGGATGQKRVSLGTFDARNPLKKGDRGGKRTAKDRTYYRRAFLKKLNDAAGQRGAEGDIARQIINEGLDSPKAKGLLSKFLGMQGADPEMKKIIKDLDNSSEFVDEITKDLKEFSVEEGGSGSSFEEMLDKTVGGKAGALEDLRILGQAAELRMEAGRNGTQMGATLADDLKNPKYSALAENLKGMSSSQQIARIRDLSTRLSGTGAFRAARIAGATNMSVEDVIKDPGKFTEDAALQSEIRKAGGNKDAIKKLMGREFSRRAGGSIVGNSFELPGNATDAEFYGLAAAQEQIGKVVDAGAKGAVSEVDYRGLEKASASLASGSAVFMDAATDIRGAARELREAASRIKNGN